MNAMRSAQYFAVQEFDEGVSGNCLIFLSDAGRNRKIKFGPADLLNEEIPGPPLISLKIFGLDLRPDHLNEFIKLPNVLQMLELLYSKLDTDLDASLPASLLDVENTDQPVQAVRKFIGPKEERDAKVIGHPACRVTGNRG